GEGPRGLEIDDQFEFSRLLDRQVTRRGTLENSAEIDAALAKRFHFARAVAHKTACDWKLSAIIQGWNRIVGCARDDLCAPTDKKRIDVTNSAPTRNWTIAAK